MISQFLGVNFPLFCSCLFPPKQKLLIMATEEGNALFNANDFEGAVASYAANLAQLGFATGPWNGEVPPKVVKRLEARKVVSAPQCCGFCSLQTDSPNITTINIIHHNAKLRHESPTGGQPVQQHRRVRAQARPAAAGAARHRSVGAPAAHLRRGGHGGSVRRRSGAPPRSPRRAAGGARRSALSSTALPRWRRC